MQLYGAFYGLLRTLAVCEALLLRPLSGKQNNVHSGRSVRATPHTTLPAPHVCDKETYDAALLNRASSSCLMEWEK